MTTDSLSLRLRPYADWVLECIKNMHPDQRDKVCDMAFNNYTRDQIVKAMEKIARPCFERDAIAMWLQITDQEKVKEIECIKNMGEEALYMAFRAAVVDLMEHKIMCHDAEGMLCLTEWMPDPKRLRSLDDGWAT